MKLKKVFTWSPSEKRLRLIRFIWAKGNGAGYGAPENYSAMLSISIEIKLPDLWIGGFWKGGRDERWLWICVVPCIPIQLHYQRSYGGHHA